MVQSLYKNWLLVSKITWGIWATLDKQWKVQKVEIWWAKFDQKIDFSKKYFPSAKTLYTEDLSNITFTYLCESSSKLLCHFWNHKSFSTTQFLCIFLAQILHTFCKISPSRYKFSGFPPLGLKFTKFLMSFSKQKVSFSSRFGSFFVPWEIILLYFFSWDFICYWQKYHIKVQIFRLALLALKFTKFVMSFLEPRVSFFQILHRSSVSWDITLLYLFI